MARFVVLFDWTDQGIKNAKDSVDRVQSARDALKPLGVTIDTIYWTLGTHDLVATISAPDGDSLAAGLLGIAKMGNIRTTTLRAFDADEFGAILGKLH